MSLPAVAGNTLYASDLYQLCQPSGGQEKGKYWLGGAIYTGSALLSQYMQSESKGATPVSVSIDTVDNAPSGIGSPSTNHLTQYGFQVYGISSGATTGANVAGNFTIQF